MRGDCATEPIDRFAGEGVARQSGLQVSLDRSGSIGRRANPVFVEGGEQEEGFPVVLSRGSRDPSIGIVDVTRDLVPAFEDESAEFDLGPDMVLFGTRTASAIAGSTPGVRSIRSSFPASLAITQRWSPAAP